MSTQSVIDSAPVVFFQMDACPFCHEAEKALQEAGISFKKVPIADHKAKLVEMTGKTSAPSVWIRGTYVGGCNDGTEAWHGVKPMLESGKFQEMVGDIEAEGAVQGDGAEEERQGCALETVTALSKKDRVLMYQHQFKTVASVAFLLFFMIYAAVRSDWGIFVSYILFATLHAFIRSIMDYKYDTAGLQGNAKRNKVLVLAALNLSQVRVAYDARGCIAAGSVGMSINMTLIAQALVKLVPMNVVNIINLLMFLAEPSISFTELVAICCLLFQIVSNSFGVVMQITSFELMTNAANAVPVKKFITMYFTSEVFVRAISLGVVMFAMVENDDVPSLLAIVPPLLLYVNRAVIMSTMYIQRGYIYSPAAPATTDGTTTCQKIIFGVFPSGFVQLFTDFPFNGDLASKKSYFAVHQAISLSESALFVLVAFVGCDFISLLPRKWAAYIVLALWVGFFVCKALFFYFYWGARIGAGSHSDKMKSETATADERSEQAREEHKQFVSATDVAVYVKKDCPECSQALNLLNAAGSSFGVKCVDDLEPVPRADVLAMLGEMVPGEILMPMIFSQTELLGGLAQVRAMLDRKEAESLSTDDLPRGAPTVEEDKEPEQRKQPVEDALIDVAPKVEEETEQEQKKQQAEYDGDCRIWHCADKGDMVSI